MALFFIGIIVGGMIGIVLIGLLGNNSYEDGYRQAVLDMNEQEEEDEKVCRISSGRESCWSSR